MNFNEYSLQIANVFDDDELFSRVYRISKKKNRTSCAVGQNVVTSLHKHSKTRIADVPSVSLYQIHGDQ